MEEGLFSQADETEKQDEAARRYAEQVEIDTLLNKGFELPVGDKKYKIRPPALAVMVSIADDMHKLTYDEAELEHENAMRGFDEQKRMLKKNAWRAARIVAKARLGKLWKIWLFSVPVTFYFFTNLTSADLKRAARLISMSFDLPGFASSIVLLSVSRVTAPPAIEEQTAL